ncbi:MAG: TlyA family RNA methyltransferase [Lachnospiraceae bacterium]|nr:TlyA family RNA methyltransferase [Lachnospiraceae bacterium]MCI9369767.1 TlyA family RNA methyltransferase [Lachnospiraceae bacterium]
MDAQNNQQNNEKDNGQMTQRIDLWLVQHKNIESRSKAQALIRMGNVICNGKIVMKTSQIVSEQDCIEISSYDYMKYVSRGGLKLEKAIQVFHLDFSGKKVLDIGSSTGGFTDCALQHGAESVIAVDVGKKVMHSSLAEDIRVELHEETDIRDFPLERLKEIDYVVCDVSFISLLSVIKPLKSAQGNFELVLLIKPQFECGAQIARRYKGVVLDKKVHRNLLNHVIQEMRDYSFFLKEITYSPVCGGDGNIEYISHFDRRESDMISFIEIDNIVETAFGSLKNKNRKK